MPILTELRGRRVTSREFAALRHPPCPTCAAPVLLKADWAGGGRDDDVWAVVDWSCPAGCGRDRRGG